MKIESDDTRTITMSKTEFETLFDICHMIDSGILYEDLDNQVRVGIVTLIVSLNRARQEMKDRG